MTYKEALEYGRSIAKQYEKDHDYLFIMGGIGINPYDTDALHLKASVYMVAKDKNKVTKYCREILEIDSEHRGARELLDRLR